MKKAEVGPPLFSWLQFILSTVEEFVNKSLYICWIVFDVRAQSLVVEAFELLDHAIDHGRREDTMLLEYFTLLVQTFGRGETTVRQLCQLRQLVLILLVMNIDVTVCSLCDF